MKDITVNIPIGVIIVKDAPDLATAAQRIRAALENADGIEVDWGEIVDLDSQVGEPL